MKAHWRFKMRQLAGFFAEQQLQLLYYASAKTTG